jgi:hypothetical protein
MSEDSDEPRYTIPHRLSDVIALISVLSQFKHAFMSEDMLVEALRGSPRSKKAFNSTGPSTWAEIVESHHEFFRRNGNKLFYALVLRSYFEETQDPKFPQNPKAKLRRQLTVEETQNLINAAVSLHEKELQRLQKNAYLIPVVTAVVTLLGIIFTALLSYSALNDKIIPKIDNLSDQIKSIRPNSKVDTIQQVDNWPMFIPYPSK